VNWSRVVVVVGTSVQNDQVLASLSLGAVLALSSICKSHSLKQARATRMLCERDFSVLAKQDCPWNQNQKLRKRYSP
jgi:hypothetical protein